MPYLSRSNWATTSSSSPYHTDYSKPWKDTKAYWNDAFRAGTGARFAYVNERMFPKLAAKVKEAGAWVCPTLIQRDSFVEGQRHTLFADQSNWKYFPPAMTTGWQKMVKDSPFKLPPKKDLEKSYRVRRALVRELHKAGVPLLLGTDLGNVGILAGFSVVEELQNFTEAGLTPYEALVTATRNPAELVLRFTRSSVLGLSPIGLTTV